MRVEYRNIPMSIPAEVIGTEVGNYITESASKNARYEAASHGWEILIGPPAIELREYRFGDFLTLLWPAQRLFFSHKEIEHDPY